MSKNDKTLTRAEIADAICRNVDIPMTEASAVLDSVLEEVINGLVNEGEVKIASFGVFEVRRKKPRVGRNPKTGIEVMITERNALTFHASNVLKQRINANQ